MAGRLDLRFDARPAVLVADDCRLVLELTRLRDLRGLAGGARRHRGAISWFSRHAEVVVRVPSKLEVRLGSSPTRLARLLGIPITGARIGSR